jgi:thiol:disulfide interchange protein DsbD
MKKLIFILTLCLMFVSVCGSASLRLKGVKEPVKDESNGFLSSFQGKAAQSPVSLSLMSSHTAVDADVPFSVRFILNMPEDHYVYGAAEEIGTPTQVFLAEGSPFEMLDVRVPDGKVKETVLGEMTFVSRILRDGAVIEADYRLRAEGVGQQIELSGHLLLQPCTANLCGQRTEIPFKMQIETGSSQLNPEYESGNEKDISAGAQNRLMEKGLLFLLLQAFLWGFLASLTPCVYPMIPITVSIFSRSGSDSSIRRFLRAFVYVCGMVLVYAVLGMIAARTGSELGAWLSKPVVVLPLSLLMVFFALSMFEVFELRLPAGLQQRFSAAGGDGIIGLFLTGGMMGFVAAPCVGPFAGSILLWIMHNPGSPFAGFLMMSSFGFGMGVLFILVALFSGRFLPRSGVWMIRIKQITGYLLLGVAFYFVSILLDKSFVHIFWGLYLVVAGSLAGAFCTLKWEDSVWRKISRGLGLVLFIWGLLLLAGLQIGARGLVFSQSADGAAAQKKSAFHVDYNEHDLAVEEAKKQGRPLLLFFTADWCLACQKMKNSVLSHPDTVALLENFVIAMLDCTDDGSENSRIKQSRYESPFLPFIAFYDAGGVFRPDFSVRGEMERRDFLEILRKLADRESVGE